MKTLQRIKPRCFAVLNFSSFILAYLRNMKGKIMAGKTYSRVVKPNVTISMPSPRCTYDILHIIWYGKCES